MEVRRAEAIHYPQKIYNASNGETELLGILEVLFLNKKWFLACTSR